MSNWVWPALGPDGESLAVKDANGNVIPENGIAIPVWTSLYDELVSLGVLKTQDPRGGGTPPSAIYTAGAVQAVRTEAELATFVGLYDGAQASTLGHEAIGDADERLWRWDAESEAAPSDDVIQVASVTVGRWIAVTQGSGGGLPDPAGQPDGTVLIVEDEAWTMRRLTQDDIGAGFAITAFARTPLTILHRRGDAALTGLSALSAYANGPPDSAGIANTLGGSVGGSDVNPPSDWDAGTTPFTAWTMTGSVRRFGTDAGADPTMTQTLSATKGGITKTSAITDVWTRDVYWGLGVAGLDSGAEILALSNSTLATGRGRTFTLSPSSQKIYYATPKAYGLATFAVNGFVGGFPDPIEVSVTNPNGLVSTYYLYESTNLLDESTTVVVT